MFNDDTELIFPPRVIAGLRDLRGAGWRALVDAAERDRAQQAAFVLMMARQCGCASCNVDTFRALHGCSQCARQALTRFRGNDKALADLYKTAHKDVQGHLKKTKLDR